MILMQRWIFRKVELWLVLLLSLAFFVILLVFGGAVLDAERDVGRFGRVGKVAVALAETSETLVQILRNDDPRRADRTAKLNGKSGWKASDGAGALAGDGYLLLSRFDGDIDGAAVELVDLRDLSVKYRWTPDADQLFQGVTPVPGADDHWNRHYFEAVHPFLLPDGDLVIKDNFSPLFRINRCGQKIWVEQSHRYNHSTEPDADGNLWIPVQIQPTKDIYPPEFNEDGLAQVTTDGKLLQVQSLVDIFQRNGLIAQIFGAGAYNSDPIHLNDIQPVLSDGPYWKKGDLFLSMRRLSTVLLYRPSTGQIIWRQQGPWLGQHDVDILDDHRISVFNNNALSRGRGPVIDGANEIVIYDFSTGTFSSPLKQALAAMQIKTHSEGLIDRTESGNLVVEEENAGHLLILSPDGALLAEFVNRDASGTIYTTSWSRAISRAEGDQVLAAVKAAPACP